MPLKKIIFLATYFSYTASGAVIDAYIFIHGTTRPYLNLQNIIAIWKQQGVERSSYATITRYMRKHGVCKYYQAFQGMGLEKINLQQNERLGAVAIANLFDYFNHIHNPQQINKYFTFGWSGMLGVKARKHAAKQLYRALVRLQRSAKVRNKQLRIHLITYSHGGTVALNLATIKRKQKIEIEELINFGVPVQYDSDYLINAPIFKNIYHFYSDSDYVQAIDHLSSKHFACHKRFTTRKNFALPNKLKQVNVQITRTVFSQYECIDQLPLKKRIFKSYHVNPGHSELWGLGWTPNSFREIFPLYPMPVVVFTPVFIDAIKRIEPCSPVLTIDLKPLLKRVCITEHICKHTHTHVFSFIEKEEFERLKKMVTEKFSATLNLREEHNQILQQAVVHANEQHNICNMLLCACSDGHQNPACIGSCYDSCSSKSCCSCLYSS